MNRRGFLQAMLAAAAAPAIVRAESLMKIVVPKQELILPDTDLIKGFGDGDFTAEMWAQPKGESWNHLAVTRNKNGVFHYINGKLVTDPSVLKQKGWQVIEQRPDKRVLIGQPGSQFIGHIDELRVTQGVERDISNSSRLIDDWLHFEIPRGDPFVIDPKYDNSTALLTPEPVKKPFSFF